jgi:hypothetical protein
VTDTSSTESGSTESGSTESGVTRTSRIVLATVLSAGILVLVFGATVVRDAGSAPEGWTTTQGLVVDHEERADSDGTTWAPVVEYVDQNGLAHRVTSTLSSSPRDPIGTVIDVAYDPSNPTDARVVGGLMGILWIIIAAIGSVMVIVAAAIALITRGGQADGGLLTGRAVPGDTTGRLRFVRGGSYALLQLLGQWVGGIVLLSLTVFLLLQGWPAMLFALISGFFAMFLLLGGTAELGRALDPRVIEVGRDGVWLPGLGERRWSDFADVRLETFSGPSGRGVSGAFGRRDTITTYRRLGFVPRDPELARRRRLAERLAGLMAMGSYGVTARIAGSQPIDLALFGVLEPELGREAFERLLEAVRVHVSLGELAERPGGLTDAARGY